MQDENICAVEPRIANESARSQFISERRVALKDLSPSDLQRALYCTKVVCAAQELGGVPDYDAGEAHR